MFNFFKRISNVLLIPPLLFFANEVVAQCDVFIEPGSVVVTDNGSGVKFEFDITNNSSTDWYGDDLKMYWSLNSVAPIWNIDYSQNTNQPPIGPGETRTIKTPWFDIPNLPSWFPDDPTTAQPWVESMEWPYYTLSFPFQGSWSPINLRLGDCGLADGAWVYGPDGELYYGPFDSDCPDVNNDAMCDCDLEITSFDPVSLDIEVEVVSHWNCGQPLNGLSNNNSANTDAVGMIHFGAHVYGWDFPWGCTTGINHPGWTFTGWSALNNPNEFLYSGDIFQANLNDLSPPNSCFNEILTDTTIIDCKEIVLWQINYSQTLSVLDGGWAIFLSGDDTQKYPDFNIENNSVLICGIPDVNGCTDPVASNYNPNATADDGSCEYLYPDANPAAHLNSSTCLDGTPANIFNIIVFNPGDDTLFYYCVEIPELNYDECFNGYEIGQFWIEPNGGQTITQITVPEGIEQITINVYEAEGEIESTFSNNIEVIPVVFNGPDPCPIPGCTDPNANNYNPEANEEDGSCEYNETSINLGNDIIWSLQGSCVNPFYNQSFVVNNTGEGVINNFSLEVVVETWDGDLVYEGTQDYNVSIDPNDSYIVSDFPDIFTGDLNHVSATLSWINEFGEIETSTQTFNLILYCWGCTDPEANNYTESEYIFDEVQDYWLSDFPNINPPTPEQIECTYDVFGCTDSEANNYNPNANIDDGSCTYDVFGCTDPEANNYNPNANIDDGSCSYDVFGCTDPDAVNYNPNANIDDGSCTYEVFGCTDMEALNYNPNANIDDGSCTYEVFGCTDMEALNYNPNANTDDGTCIYPNYGPCDEFDGSSFTPNAFTPNNDGLNDAWRVITETDCWNKWELVIYNRWGQVVYEMDDPSQVWDGSFRGGEYYVSDGVYAFTLRGVAWNLTTLETKGFITVLR
jgi:gliding motility-associated-like protein